MQGPKIDIVTKLFPYPCGHPILSIEVGVGPLPATSMDQQDISCGVPKNCMKNGSSKKIHRSNVAQSLHGNPGTKSQITPEMTDNHSFRYTKTKHRKPKIKGTTPFHQLRNWLYDVYACMHACMDVCMHVCMHVCMYGLNG